MPRSDQMTTSEFGICRTKRATLDNDDLYHFFCGKSIVANLELFLIIFQETKEHWALASGIPSSVGHFLFANQTCYYFLCLIISKCCCVAFLVVLKL